MKRIIASLLLLACFGWTGAQTLNVVTGDVTYAFTCDQTDDMEFTGTQSVTICNREFFVEEISQMAVVDEEVGDNTVSISYSGATAKVVVAGNIAQYINAEVHGAHVSIIADELLPDEVTYTLQGISDDGSFFMDGERKAVFILNGLSLNCPDSAAVNIQCGKLITMVLAEGTENELADGLTSVTDDGSDAHKAALVINGHSEWEGSGSLTLHGNVKHGFLADEYVLLNNGLGTLTVATAVGDGFHVNEYFLMQGGTVNITAIGDGIDVGAKSSSDAEENGQLMIAGGTLSVQTSGVDVKGMKCDAEMLISGGTNSVIVTGDGSKGLSAPGAINITGGKTTVVTTGEIATVDGDEKKPHGVKSDADITLAGGEIYVAASADGGKAFDTDTYIYTNGATVMGIGGKASTPSSLSTHEFTKYKDVNVAAGCTVSYDGVTFKVPEIYKNSSAKILVSK